MAKSYSIYDTPDGFAFTIGDKGYQVFMYNDTDGNLHITFGKSKIYPRGCHKAEKFDHQLIEHFEESGCKIQEIVIIFTDGVNEIYIAEIPELENFGRSTSDYLYMIDDASRYPREDGKEEYRTYNIRCDHAGTRYDDYYSVKSDTKNFTFFRDEYLKPTNDCESAKRLQWRSADREFFYFCCATMYYVDNVKYITQTLGPIQ